ncbi:MAG TPA: hypothetical protein VF297_26850 [Pyrinomonadaceae bacterium]
MTIVSVPRVNFFDRQFLRVNEFRDEQLYQLAARRLHNVAQHYWGIVTGLEIALEEGALVVRPGMAVDGYGRELLLPEKQRLAPETFDDLGTEKLDVWLVYARLDGEQAPEGYGGCGASGAREAYRSLETPRVRLEKPVANTVDARRPPGVPAAVLDSKVPVLSDDPKEVWRVYLGRITRLGGDPPYNIDFSQRPYVGLVGDVVDHPANATRVEVGKQSNVAQTREVGGVTYVYDRGADPQRKQSRRFAVFIPEDGDTAEGQERVVLSPRLEILQDGLLRIRGRTVLNGDLRVVGGAVQFVTAATPSEGNPPQVPTIHRVRDDERDQLRIDLGSEGTLDREFVIGFSKDDGSFTPCLKIELKDLSGSGAPSPLVTVYGDLKVEGRVVGELLKRTVSQEAANAFVASYQAGVAAGTP